MRVTSAVEELSDLNSAIPTSLPSVLIRWKAPAGGFAPQILSILVETYGEAVLPSSETAGTA
jgi:hypothetical protein